MKEIPITKARTDLSAVISQAEVGGMHILLTRGGRRVAAIVPLWEYNRIAADGLDYTSAPLPTERPWIRLAVAGRTLTDDTIGQARGVLDSHGWTQEVLGLRCGHDQRDGGPAAILTVEGEREAEVYAAAHVLVEALDGARLEARSTPRGV